MEQHKNTPVPDLEYDPRTQIYSFDDDQFQVYYQPKHDAQTGKLVGAEALIRWIHPNLGFISPGDFIPVFEKKGYISELDVYVWGKTCENLRKWMDRGVPVVPISVNSSRIELSDDNNFFERRVELTKKWNVPADLMHIEVTETMFGSRMDDVVCTLNKCHDFGFGIELDDFGIGYSSLHTLGDLPLDIVKLDMSFVQQLDDPKKERVMTGCVNLIKNMNLKIVAEGVETERQYHRIKELDIDIVQGYYYSRPLPEKAFEEYLSRVPIINPEEMQARDASRKINVASFGDIDQCQFLLSHLMSGLLNMWMSVFIIDIRTGRSNELCDTQDFKNTITESVMSDEIQEIYIQKSLMPKYQAPYRAFFDFSTMEARFKEDRTLRLEFEDYHNGWMRSTILPAGYDVDGHLTHIVLTVERINSEKHEQTQMQRLSEEDNLTGLRNRFSGTIVVNQLLLQRKPFELMLMDIDHFKHINDTYGHHVGDEVLVALAQTLQSDFPEAEAIRLGGDEFMLVIKGMQSRTRLTERLQAFFQHFSTITVPGMDKRTPLAVSIGGICYDGREQRTFDQLYHIVDAFMYESKQFEGCSYVSDDYRMPDIRLAFSQQERADKEQRNQLHLEQLLNYFARPDVPDTSYDYLYKLIWKYFMVLDPFMTEKVVGDILLPHYRSKPVRDVSLCGRLARLCVQLGNSLFNIYMMGDEQMLPRSMEMFREAIAVADALPIDSSEFACKAFAIAMLLGHPGLESDFVPKGREAMKLYERLRGIIEHFGGNCGGPGDRHFTSVMHSAVCYPVLRARDLQMKASLTEEENAELQELLTYVHDHLTPDGHYDMLVLMKAPDTLIHVALPAVLGLITDRESFAQLREAYQSMPDLFFEHIDSYIGVCVQIMHAALYYINHIDFTAEEKERYTRECLQFIVRVLQHHDNSQPCYEINLLTDMVVNNLLSRRFMSVAEKQHFLLHDVGSTMPYTVTHTIGMARYARVITKCIIDEHPELMIGLFGFRSACEVQTNKAQILDFMHVSCLLHDLGKVRMREIVRNVFRKIGGHELSIVHAHPEFAERMLHIDDSLLKYRDVVLGHHKWYNGQGGYPASFDNTKSPVRILIDISSIADTLEAATSHLGRSYRKPKNFIQIMEELRHQSGTRYNRDVVYAIFCSHETYMRLEELIDEGR